MSVPPSPVSKPSKSRGRWFALAGGGVLTLTIYRSFTFDHWWDGWFSVGALLILQSPAILVMGGAIFSRRWVVLLGSILESALFILTWIEYRYLGVSLFLWVIAIVLSFVGFGTMKKRGGAGPMAAVAGPAVGTPEWRIAQIQAAEAAQRHAEDEARQWAQAYRDSHDGAEPPADFHPPVLAASSPGAYAGTGVAPQGGTNVFAILSLIFGLMGGLLAIPFGFVALSQIKRTREGGKGMAVTGLVFAFTWLAIIIALAVWGAVASSGSGY